VNEIQVWSVGGMILTEENWIATFPSTMPHALAWGRTWPCMV